MRKNHFILLLLCFFFFLSACNQEYEIEKWPEVVNKYDPSKPKSLDRIIPSVGKIDQTFIVEGNFPGELTDMKVYFGSKRAILTATDGKSITGLIPKQPDGYNLISVVIGSDSIAPQNLKFKYKQSRSIKTIAGKLGTDKWMTDDQYRNADINSVTFGEMHYVAAVKGQKGDNVIAIETGWGNRLFFLSLDDNRVQFLSSPVPLCAPAVPSSRDRFYGTSFWGDRGNRTLYVFAKDESWAAKSTGISVSSDDFANAKSSSITFAEDDNTLYLFDNEGRIAEINIASKDYKIYTTAEKKPANINAANFGGLISGELPSRFGNWEDSYLAYSKFHKCFFASFTEEDAIYKYVKNNDGTWTVELYAGRNGEGANPGHRLTDAKFHNPHGMAINADGEIFVCNKGHFISRIHGDLVDIVSGKYNTWSPLSNGEPSESILDQPRNFAVDFEGNYFFAGGNDRTVRKLSIE